VFVAASCDRRAAARSRLPQLTGIIASSSSSVSLSSGLPLQAADTHTLHVSASQPSALVHSTCQPSALLPVPVNIDHCHWNAFYPAMLATTSSSAGQVHQFRNCAGQVQQFPSVAAAALVDVLRMSSVGPSLLLTPTPAVQTLMSAAESDSHDECQQVSALSSSQCSAPVSLLPFSLPGCSVNAILTATTHFLPGSRPAPPVIGCECCDSPMTGIVCLQSPALATH